MWTNNLRFDFSRYDVGTPGNSGFGLFHEPGEVPKPILPFSTDELTGVDLTHLIHTWDIASAKGGNGGGGSPGGGKGGGGGGGGGGALTFDPYTSGPADGASGYNITIEFSGDGWTQEYHDLFVGAANLLTTLIVGDVADAKVIGGGGPPRTVDDIVISAQITYIDGPGSVLGQAGPTSVRTGSHLPATAIMQFDVDDIGAYFQGGLFDDIILHEMSHSLGFGSIWSYFSGLVVDGLYQGINAVTEYVNAGGDWAGIPVEQDGGGGTAGSHWDEVAFDNELMTGYIDGSNYFSEMSAASFADLGYTIDSGYGSIVMGPVDVSGFVAFA